MLDESEHVSVPTWIRLDSALALFAPTNVMRTMDDGEMARDFPPPGYIDQIDRH
jgi:hypothetical protein